MKQIKLQLPDKMYYQFQSMADKERQDTDEFIEQTLLDKVEYYEQVEFQRELNQMILDWDWPEKQPKKHTTKLQNLTGVIKEMADGCDFTEAISRRAEEARREDPIRGAEYLAVVRADCTQIYRGAAHGVEEFKREVDNLLECHNYTC
jgi:hypothetical protein